MVYLDACLLIYLVESHPLLGAPVRAALAAHPDTRFAISALTRMECLLQPMRSGNLALQRYYEASFDSFAWLPIDDAVFDLATQLRARHRLKTPDALHLACAQQGRKRGQGPSACAHQTACCSGGRRRAAEGP